MNFIAAVLEAQNQDLAIRQLRLPKILEAGQVLVQVHASGICGAQLGEIAGVKGKDAHLPHLLGHEGAGVVMECGPGVQHVAVGDHVVMHWRRGRGIDSRPPRYTMVDYNDGSYSEHLQARARGEVSVGGGWVTTFNELAVVSENRLTPIAHDIPFRIAALLGCAVTTGLGLITHEARVKIGQSVAVFGCGGVGLNVIQGASLVSALPIVGIDITEEKVRLARMLGATATLMTAGNHARTHIIGGLKALGLEAGVDVCVDTTGQPHIIELAFDVLAPQGCLYLVGQGLHDQKITLETRPMHTGKTIVASDGGHTNPAVDIPRYLNLYRAGKLRLDQLITHQDKLLNINQLLEQVRKGHACRAIVMLRQDTGEPC